MQHLDEGVIHAWLDNALPADEAARVAAHTEECRECAAAVAEARGMIAGASRIVSALDVARGGVVPVSSADRTRSLWRRLYLTPTRAAIAATILLAVGSVFTLRHRPASDRLPVGRMIDSPAITRQSARAAAPPRVPDSTPSAKPTAAATAPRVKAVRDSAPTASATDVLRETPSTRAPAAAPVPAAKAMDAMVDSAKTSQAAANLAQSQQKSVVAGSAGASPETRSSEAARREVVPRATNAPSSAMGTFASARLEETVMTAAPGAVCYAIRPSPGDTTTWLRALPERFALGTASQNGSERPGGDVKIPSSSGQVDSVLQGSSWQQVGPSHVMIALDAQRTIDLHIMPALTAEASSGGVMRAVVVTRASCPR